MKDIRMIVSDIDNTLVGRDGKMSPLTVKTLRECEDRGILVVLASGRCLKGMLPICAEAALKSPTISSGGGRADESPDGPIFFEDVIEPHTAAAVCEKLLSAGCFMTSYTRDHIYLMHEINGYGSRSWYRSEAVNKQMGVVADDAFRMRAEGTVRPYKFEAYSDDAERLNALRQAFTDEGLSVSSAFSYNIEIMAPGGGKQRAMMSAAKRFRIDRSQIMAFGDGTNDIGMIREAGVGVAVDNAVEELKAAADLIAPHHDDSGVARAIRKYVFGEDSI